MNIKTVITGFIVGLSLVGLNMSSAQAIPLTMSFNIGAGSGVIKYDAADPTSGIDTLTFADITIGTSTYGTSDVGGTGYTVFNTTGDDFLLTFDPNAGTGILSYGPAQDGQAFRGIGEVTISATVPEPATLALLGLGLAFLGGASRKRN